MERFLYILSRDPYPFFWAASVVITLLFLVNDIMAYKQFKAYHDLMTKRLPQR